MADKNFLLLSLDDDHAKKVANILSNKSCAKILKFVTSQKATASEIAKELKIPLSTVHYNLKQLLKAKLIQANEFHYSEKGKEVLHYTVANKYIVIAPSQDKEGFLEKLKTILPIAGVIAIGGFLVSLLSKTAKSAMLSAPKMLDSASFARAGADVMMESALQGVNEVATFAAQNVSTTVAQSSTQPISDVVLHSSPTWFSVLVQQQWFWFVVGSLFALGAYYLVKFLLKKK